MTRSRRTLLWALFLLLAGVFLLLKNLGVMGAWGDAAWGGIFAAGGLGFLIWFATNVRQWWRAIPGFTLLSSGGAILLQWRGINLGPWTPAVVLFGMALGFWAVLLVQSDNWWAAIPAGVLTVLGALTGFQTALGSNWLAAFFGGIGLVFTLLYFMRRSQPAGWWPAVPAASLLLLGVVTVAGSVEAMGPVGRWWPALLILVGIVNLVFWFGRVGGAPAKPKTIPQPQTESIKPARGAFVTDRVPEAPAAAVPAAPPAPRKTSVADERTAEPPAAPTVDIYDLIRNQPPEEKPANDKPAEGPAGGQTGTSGQS